MEPVTLMKLPLRDGELDRIRESVGRVSYAVDSLLAGSVVVIADETRQAGYLALAGSRVTVSTVAWMVRHGSGYLCVPLLPDRARDLSIPLMMPTSDRLRSSHFGVSVDAACGVTTGISAYDRARTIALLTDPASVSGDFVRPGHVVPEYVSPGGVLSRPRPAEALLDLLRTGELPPVGVLCALVSRRDPTALAGWEEMREFCSTTGAALIGVSDLVAFRELTEPLSVRARTQADWLGVMGV